MARSKSRLQLINSCREQRRKAAWATDYDYLDKMPDHILEYLIAFSHLWYKGNPHLCNHPQIIVTAEMRTESYRRNNTAQIDLYNQVFIELEEDISQVADLSNEDRIIDIIDKRY